MLRSFALLLPAALLSASASAQISFSYGPEDAPLGCPVHLTFNNDSGQTLQWDPCGFQVVDGTNTPVYVPPCGGSVTLDPGEIHDHVWPQVDQNGVQVAAGTYYLGDVSGVAIQVGSVTTAISPIGAPVLGTTRHYQLSSPQDPGARYVLLASAGTSPGISTCAGMIPLQRDRIFGLSRRPSNAFLNFAGVLDGSGNTQLPALAIPSNPAVAGLRLHLAFLVLDSGGACPIRRISSGYELFIR